MVEELLLIDCSNTAEFLIKLSIIKYSEYLF